MVVEVLCNKREGQVGNRTLVVLLNEVTMCAKPLQRLLLDTSPPFDPSYSKH